MKTSSLIIHWLPLLRLWPLMLLCRLCPQRRFLREERRYWIRHVLGEEGEERFSDRFRLFCLPEYRSIVYLRIGGLRHFVEWMAPGQRPLQISLTSAQVGMGFVLQHGHSTRIGARSIGQNVQIWHNVTVGTDRSHSGHLPTIGNRVLIYTGAIVFGNITVGDDAIIAAGAIVNKDVPPGAIVAGNPARIVKYRTAKPQSTPES